MPDAHSRLTSGGLQDLVTNHLHRHPEHRDAFLSDPTAALLLHLGVASGRRLAAIADTADTIHVVIPSDPDELGEADLDRVAGGARGGALIAADFNYIERPYSTFERAGVPPTPAAVPDTIYRRPSVTSSPWRLFRTASASTPTLM